MSEYVPKRLSKSAAPLQLPPSDAGTFDFYLESSVPTTDDLDTRGPVPPPPPMSKQKRSCIRFALAIVSGVAVVASASIGYNLWHFYHHSSNVGQQLVTAGQMQLQAEAASVPLTQDCTSLNGDVLGLLDVPSIKLVAPVVQGVNAAQLASAVGHVPTSGMPGLAGTTVLAARDETWFHNLSQIHPGDIIEYASACHSFQYRVSIVKQVAPSHQIYQDTGQIDLVTNWPLDTPHYSNRLYLVQGVLVGQIDKAVEIDAPVVSPAPRANVPVDWVKTATLASNRVLLGSLTVTGSPSPAWTQSPSPLNATAAAQSQFFAALDMAQQDALIPWLGYTDVGWSSAVPVIHSKLVGYLQTSLQVQGDQVVGAIIAVPIRQQNGHLLRITATEQVENGVFHMTGWATAPMLG